MYLESVELTNVRTFGHLQWMLDADTSRAGWHVILGDNGAGKSTFLRAIALALIGAFDAPAMRINPRRFIANTHDKAEIGLQLSYDNKWDQPALAGNASSSPESGRLLRKLDIKTSGMIFRSSEDILDKAMLAGTGGWFSAAFGPFRRFSGGAVNNRELFSAFPRLEPYLSVFGEDVAFTEIIEWLGLLRFKELESQVTKSRDAARKSLLERIKIFVNQPDFLPFGARLDSVSSDSVTFLDGNGVEVPLLELSDGYRSVLSMTFELVRLMVAGYGEAKLFSADGTQIVAPGVVLIDEVDAHLHPNWQRDIGPWLCRLFPNVQFIVTTHSPFVCQQAIRGSIWKLPTPGTDEAFRRVEGEELARLIYGDALDALESAAIGVAHNRSEVAQHMMDELAALNRRKTRSTLAETDRRRREELIEKLQPVLRGHF